LSPWVLAGLAAAIYCLARGIMDLRQGAMAWGVLGILSALVILSAPTAIHILSIRVPAGLSKAVP
jgi:hypothetical protein